MINKFKKLIGCSFLVIVICLFHLDMSFALNTNVNSLNNSTENTLLLRSTSGTVPSNGSRTFYINLDNYVGVNKTFLVNATSNSSTGVLFIRLISPRGTEVSQDWIMSVNEVAQWSVFLPSSGQWTVQITSNGTTSSVNVFLNWL